MFVVSYKLKEKETRGAGKVKKMLAGSEKDDNNNNNKNFIQYSDGRLQEVSIKGNCRKRAQAT